MIEFWFGLYLGIGLGYAGFILADVGLGRGWTLLLRVPLLVLFWPILFASAFAHGD